MNIIIVGPDGSGKSTLAADLSKHLLMPVYHGHGNDVEKVERWEEMESWDNVIFDRSYYIDDQVYSPVVGVEPCEWPSGSKLISDSLIIYWDNTMAETNVREQGDDYIESSMVEAVRSSYWKFFIQDNISPQVKMYSEGFDEYEQDLDDIVKYVYQWKKSKR